ncbi:hypothetical protein L1999_09150 [Neobacillus drentensis]|uniref:hypothetical protein n=1 Tax=Neobacillus drentensis TaxID=220684 RepID=UPI001F2EF0BA|nr:hypothetical protein [Neobacillus drentensis]ULT59992.1 hypothetical protein L1999_09150 [Neobacillus drentensis]
MGEIEKANSIINYQWILNYPSGYAYAHWDAYKDGFIRDHNKKPPVSHSVPFILSAMFTTVGVVYGSKNSIGPVFTGVGCYFLGIVTGAIIIKISNKHHFE